MSALREALRRAGYDFRKNKIIASIIGDHIADDIRVFGLYEGDQLRVLRDHVLDLHQCSRAVAVDVGANIGNHALFFSDMFKHVVAFEPNPVARTLLELNLKLNGVANVEVRCEGLSDHHGTATLATKTGNLGATRAIDSGEAFNDSVASHELVELVIGDDVLRSGDRIGLLKIDVEGGEDRVLRGLQRTIARDRPVVMMEQLEDAIDEESGRSPSIEFLAALDYEIFEISRHHRRKRLSRLFGSSGVVVDYRIVPVTKLEKKDYSVLVFLPRATIDNARNDDSSNEPRRFEAS